MSKLTRRNFLLSTGVATIAAPVLANIPTESDAVFIERLENELTYMVDLFDTLPPKRQQEIIAGYDRLSADVYADEGTTEFAVNLKSFLIKRAKPIN